MAALSNSYQSALVLILWFEPHAEIAVNVQQVGGGAVRNFPVSPVKPNCLGFCNTTKSCLQKYVNWKTPNFHSSYSIVYFSSGLIKSLWNTESSFLSLETESMSKAGESIKERTKKKRHITK